MHELALYSQIPTTRHTQVLQILSGVTASQPTETLEQTLIYQQLRLPDSGTSKKAANRGTTAQPLRLTYHKLVRNLKEPSGDKTPWTFRSEDVPSPGVQNLIMRSVIETFITEADLERFRQGQVWYEYINQFLAQPAHRFIHGNIIIRVSRLLSVPEGTGALEPLDAPVPALEDCKPVDPSGSFMFEAVVRVEDGGNSKLVEMATKELLGFKKMVEGVVDLRVPERLSLDSRVKVKGT
ncbi:hypothetical protein LTR17_000847 [Elasticomyces elasticus]|nr:hypothetical protein LTR17_000847 [Elasticomyces elasticus]